MPLCRISLWPDPPTGEPPSRSRAYDVVIVGGGGHGLSTAYYLAKNHGITNVCVVEKGWLAGGNMARNTTVIRSNYLWDESSAIYEHSLKLWEGLEEDLGSDLQFSQRGVLNLAHSLGDVRSSMRRVHANRLNGIDAEWLTPEDVKAFCPIVNISPDVRYPVLGATLQRRGGIARHDKVAWGYATRRERARRRHRRALRGDGVRPRARRARRGRSDHAGRHRGRQGRRSSPPATRASSPRWSGSGCRCSRTRCRRSSRCCSSRCSTAS